MNWSDLYSGVASTGAAVQMHAGMTTGPNQSIVTGSGQISGARGGTGAAFSWLALAAGLVALRVLIAMGGRVA